MAYARKYSIVPGLLGYTVLAEENGVWTGITPKPFETKEKAEAAIRRLSEAHSYYNENGEAV